MEQSPCVRICTLNDDEICIGCGRMAEEIKFWITFSDKEKSSIKSQLKSRLDDIAKKMRTKRMLKN